MPILSEMYGRMRQRYLKEHRPSLYSSLILSEKLYSHLLEIDRAARERMDTMLPRMMEAAGVGRPPGIHRARNDAAPHDGGGRRDRGLEGPRPYAVGGADEYAESTGGGNDTVRTDFQLSLRIEAAYAASVRFYNTFDTFSALYSLRQRNIINCVSWYR